MESPEPTSQVLFEDGGRVEHTVLPARPALSVGFISPVPVLTADSVSGMPYQMREHIRRRCEHLCTLEPARPSTPSTQERVIRLARPLAASCSPERRAFARRLVNGAAVRLGDSIPGLTYRRTLRSASRSSVSIQRQADHHRLDVLFGCCISSSLSCLETGVPIVYYSDTTATLLTQTYPQAVRRSAGYKAACDTLERTALGKCAAAIFATSAALESAIDDYGLPPERGCVVPMGAHITARPGAAHPPAPPRDHRLRLCIVAADPFRKRLALAIRATEILCQRGWLAQLTLIGPPTPESMRSNVVITPGPLRLSDPADRRKHQDILAASHLLLLPSLAETFGIAPCEAAHFARPSVVSAAGGLPSVVLHGQTGLVLPLNASAAQYADAIDGLMRDETRYLSMCHAAFDHAHRVLSWDRWAEEVVRILRDVAIRSRRPSAHRTRSPA